MRRQVTTTEVRCDLCGGDIVDDIDGPQSVGPLDLCWMCSKVYRSCESCGSLPTFPDVQATWAGNCLACWRLAMELPRGKCSAVGPLGYTGWANKHRCACDQLPGHGCRSHHCPLCGDAWGPL